MGPDFLCIGMGKSGTGWLYDQLDSHPAFRMPVIKELHYLDSEVLRTANKRVKAIVGRTREREAEIREAHGKRLLDDADYAFVEELYAAKGRAMDLAHYARLFRFKGDRLSGDVSPSYCGMEDAAIARAMAAFPEIKVVLMVRDPVERAWSHLSMRLRGAKRGKAELRAALRDADAFRDMLATSNIARIGRPAQIARKWMRHIPEQRFAVFFFDDLAADPAALRDRALTFLGADAAQETAHDAAHNPKSGKRKRELTDELRQVLVEHFKDELADGAKLWGGHAQGWAEKYGV